MTKYSAKHEDIMYNERPLSNRTEGNEKRPLSNCYVTFLINLEASYVVLVPHKF